ncbi:MULTISPECIES: EAL domain-containing protein [unclassified Rhizobium]|uniref:bifunctional diguanylate cyclase/phosphodiesterase n=2 Tax=unclassified Rhizobium TaxID=2613769 RepID=UPI001FEF493C|nr:MULTISPECIES: EAL domain-containing protein [unclassified Rhizobium]
MLARGSSLEDACDRICEHAERLAAGVLCSIVTVDRDGLLHPLAGPTIAKTYSNALDGIPIGPDVGSCGTAAHFRRPIAVTDIFADPLWIPYRSLADILAKEHGVKACWSSPILRSDGRVLGAFGFYYKDNRGPTPEERMIVAEYLDLCSLVLEREEVKADNQRLAFFDNLTGFGNRANFLKTLEAAIDGGAGPLSVLLIDIDHLGRVNDAFGHATGDRLILEVGQTVARIAAPVATFRVDADEFAVLIENRSTELSAVSAEILRAIENRTPRRNEHLLPVSVTCGGAISEPSQPPDVPTFLQHANLALHHAKRTARGGFVLYSDDLAGAIANRFRVLQTVTSALAEDRIEAHYQPIVSLATQEIVGLEALCRIRLDGGQILSAGAFAEALQDLSMGHLLTDRMLEQVARDIRYWLDLGMSFQYVSVNVSMADFNQGNLCERIKSVFAHHRTPLKHVVLEVTETVYMDEKDGKVAQAIEELRREGLLVALDDFGTGYASLTHLLNFPVDIIKIDKTFIDRMSDGPGAVIVKALLDMSIGLGTRIVAEGVETEDQADRLRRLGCPYVQGYLFGRPVDRDRTTEALRADTFALASKAGQKA